MRKLQLGNRRVPSQSTRKRAIPVPVETETETVTDQDVVEVSAEITEQLATDVDETEGVERVAESEDESSDDTKTEGADDLRPPARWRRIKWSRVLAFGVLPAMALVIAVGAGFLKWQDAWVRGSKVAGMISSSGRIAFSSGSPSRAMIGAESEAKIIMTPSVAKGARYGKRS